MNNVLKFFYFVILGVFAVVGCQTPQPTRFAVEDDIVIEEVLIPEPDERYEVSWNNGLFEYKVIDGERSFRCLSEKATLRDLANFAMNVCYNGYLADKIKSKKPLTIEDGVLLTFILNAQLTTVDTFSVALLGDMTSPGLLHSFIVQCKDHADSFSQDESNPEILRQQNDAFTELKVNFLEETDGIRAPMRIWGDGFKAIDQVVIAGVFQEIRKGAIASDNSNGNTFRNHPWMWTTTLMLSGLSGGVIMYALSPDEPNVIESACDKYERDSITGKEQWQAMRNALSTYTSELDRLMKDMRDYVVSDGVKDSASRRIVEDALASTSNDYQGIQKYLDYAIYDLPFALLTYKARARMKDCQGFFNDDEDKMKEVWVDYANAVSDKEMLRNVRTWYSASSYSELINLLKNEMWEKDFKAFCKETRLFKINQVNGGNGQNEVVPYYDN